MGNFEEQQLKAAKMVKDNEEFFPNVIYKEQVWPPRTGA